MSFLSFLPAIGGAVAGLLGSDKDQTVTQQQQLPSFLQPYAPQYAQMGYDLSQMPFNPYPYESVAPFTQDQNTAMDMVRQQATGGMNPLYGASQDQTMATMRGDYLNPQSNPYLQQTYDLAADRMTDAYSRGTAAQTDANFARAGAFGGSAWNERQQANEQSLGDSLAGLGANIFGQNYAQERNRQQQASQFAPSLAGNMSAQGFRNAEALLNTGGMQQGLGQQYLTDDMQRFNQAVQYPYQQFAQFGQMFNPALGSQSTQTMPGVSPINGLLGGALGGLGIYNAGTNAGIWGGNTGLGSATSTTPYVGGITPPTGIWG